MHISDGILSVPVWLGSYVVTAGIVAATTRKMDSQDVPKLSVVTSVFFVASLIHIPIGPITIHLILNGLVGIILGPMAFVSIFMGLVLQALLFQHGGITTIGANFIIMAIPAFLAYNIFNLQKRFNFRYNEAILGAIAGVCGIFLGAIILAILLVTTGSEFIGIAKLVLLAHIPIMIIEGVICASTILFLVKVKPEILIPIKKPLSNK
jgi:cobalt/nickel transport system permease protein